MSVASELECESERAAATARLPKTPLETSIDRGASESIRSRSRFGGFGLLSLAAMTLAALRGARASEPNVSILDDDHITYKELDHGKFELVTKEAIPRHIIVDDPGETVIVRRSGSSMSVNPVDNNATRMQELSKAQQDALANYEKGMGETGSSAPPFSDPALLEPINFIQSDDTEATQTALAPVPVFVFTSVVVPIVRLPPPPPPPPPTLEITGIGGQIEVGVNNIINAAAANSGVLITGTTSGVEDGRIVMVSIVDSSNHVVYNGTATVANNTWSINVSPAEAKMLADGADTLKADVTNAAGNTAEASHAIRVDETPPTIAINNTIVSNDVVNIKVAGTGFAIAGTATDAENGQPVTVKIVDSSGHVVDAFTTTLTNNTWSINVTSNQAKLLHDGTYTVTADVSDTAGNPAQEATQAIAVDETPPTVTWLPRAECGVEGKAIALGSIVATANTVPGHSNSVQSLVVSGIPVGAVLTDGMHCFLATSGDTSVDVKSWNLSNLKIAPPNDTNFTLTVTATDQDANTASANELVTVAPLAPALHPVAAHGYEDTAIALDLGVMARSLCGANGDAIPNSLAAVVVSDIPAGATLSDGTGLPGHCFTATAANTSIDVANWNLPCLKITAPEGFEGCFTLNIAATDRDSEGNISATVTATEVVTVAPVAEPPTACAPATLTLYENATCVPIAGVRVGPLAEDADDTVRATLTVSHGTLHVASLSGVKVTGDDCATLTLSGSAAAVDALLAGLTYTPACGYEGCDTLHLSVTSRDGFNTYPGVATASTAITVKDRDDWSDGVAPTLAASTFTGINGGSATELSAPPAASGTVTKGATGEIAAASATATDFASASGTNASLVPESSQNFIRQDTPDNNSAAAAPNTGDALTDTIMGGFGAVLLTGGNGTATIGTANAVPDTTRNGGNGDTIAGEHWAHSLGGQSTDDHFVFLSTDHGADRWHTSSDFKPKSDGIDLTALGLADFVILAFDSTSTLVPAHTIAWIYDSAVDQTTVYVNSTDHSLNIGDTLLVEIHLQGMPTIEPSELAFAPETTALLAAVASTDPGNATAHNDATAVAVVSANVSSDATSEAHDKLIGQASDHCHAPDTDRDRMELSDHAGSIRDDESGKHFAGTTSDEVARAPTQLTDTQLSVSPQHALQTETVTASNPETTLDKADAPANGSGAVPAPSNLIHTASTAVPQTNAPDMADPKTDLHSDEHSLAPGHDWTHPSRGDWHFNFSWKGDGSAHDADTGISAAHMNASTHGDDAFHFDLSSMTHEASAAGDTVGHHSNEGNSGEPSADHFHAAHHVSHDLMV